MKNPATKVSRRPGMCVGCQEAQGTIKVPELGQVCDSCHEVLDIVFEVERERIQEAIKKLKSFLETF